MEYTIDERTWASPSCKVSLGKAEHPGASNGTFSPNRDEIRGEVHAWAGKRRRIEGDRVAVAGTRYALRPFKGKARFFLRGTGWIRVRDRVEGSPGYVQVMRVRKPAVGAVALACAATALFALSCSIGVEPQNVPAYFADATGITHNNADAHATIEYASYESTPDQIWKAGQLHQDTVLRLPAEVSVDSEDGGTSVSENPIVASPHIYVDLNGDGTFGEDELVFNPIEYDGNGNEQSWGRFLEPGQQIDGIDLVHEVPAGSYAAETLWTPLSKDDESPANPMTFRWNLTVE